MINPAYLDYHSNDTSLNWYKLSPVYVCIDNSCQFIKKYHYAESLFILFSVISIRSPLVYGRAGV